MNSSAKYTLHVSTMIFCMVAGLISIGLLLLLLFVNSVKENFPFLIITLEIGLLLIITNAIFSIYSYEGKVYMLSRIQKYQRVSATTCPDYYTMNVENGKRFCQNKYVNAKGDTMRYIFPSGSGADRVDIITNFDGKLLQDVCKTLDTPDYKDIPWTDMRPKCDEITYM